MPQLYSRAVVANRYSIWHLMHGPRESTMKWLGTSSWGLLPQAWDEHTLETKHSVEWVADVGSQVSKQRAVSPSERVEHPKRKFLLEAFSDPSKLRPVWFAQSYLPLWTSKIFCVLTFICSVSFTNVCPSVLMVTKDELDGWYYSCRDHNNSGLHSIPPSVYSESR